MRFLRARPEEPPQSASSRTLHAVDHSDPSGSSRSALLHELCAGLSGNEFGGFNFAAESLLLIDNIDRAIVSFKNDESLKNNKDLNKIIDGIEIVKKDLVSIFKKNGIEAIECVNKKFDPNFHQAMLELEDNTKEAGTVVQEIQKGYMMKDRLLRPSLVGVTKKREEKVDKSINDEKKGQNK